MGVNNPLVYNTVLYYFDLWVGRWEGVSEYAKMRGNLVVVELHTDNRQRSFCAS